VAKTEMHRERAVQIDVIEVEDGRIPLGEEQRLSD
jgi:hypothetical protein